MPKVWLYYIALVLPLVVRVLTLTFFTDWLWYHHYEKAFYFLSSLSVQPQFVQFIGGWAYPVFVGTVICRWVMDEDGESLPLQFLMLPLVYAPFAIVGEVLTHAEFHASMLYTFPLVIIPFGYIYVFAWVIFIWVVEKLRLVL